MKLKVLTTFTSSLSYDLRIYVVHGDLWFVSKVKVSPQTATVWTDLCPCNTSNTLTHTTLVHLSSPASTPTVCTPSSTLRSNAFMCIYSPTLKASTCQQDGYSGSQDLIFASSVTYRLRWKPPLLLWLDLQEVNKGWYNALWSDGNMILSSQDLIQWHITPNILPQHNSN